MKKMLIYPVVILLVLAVACSKSNSNGHTVKYTVSGTAKLNVTYSDQNFVVQTVNNVDSNWTYSFSTNQDGKITYLTVISVDSSNVGARIFIDNQQSAQNNGSNRIAISAQIP